MYHYTYLIEFPNSMKYIGVHSTKIRPELDTCYLGSGRRLPERNIHSCIKTILDIYTSRAEAVESEKIYITKHKCVESDLWYNVRNWNYDKHGQTAATSIGIAASTHKLIGRTKDTHSYIRKANIKRSSYTGSNRTPAQIAGQLKGADTIRGTKNPLKACKGTKNGSFEPWYYIPNTTGLMIIVDNVSKQEYASKLGLSPRQLTHRFHYTNIGKPVKQGICKGYIFGNVKDLKTDID